MTRKPSSFLFLLRSVKQGLALAGNKYEIPSSQSRHFHTRRFLLSSGTSDPNLRLFPFIRNNNKNNQQQQQNLDFSSLPQSSSSTSAVIRTTTSGENEERNRLHIEVTSIENIKPAVPTPHHLKSYELSILDQLHHNVYVAFIYYYLNNDVVDDDTENGSKRRLDVLKQSLSETLTTFYPLSGNVRDARFIDCNDDGVHYVEAKVKDDLSLLDFLKEPDNNYMHKLLPFDPGCTELRSKRHLVLVQATTFKCGGIALGLYTSHKILDGRSHTAFLKAWAATARGEEVVTSEEDNPFICPSIFYPDPTLPVTAILDAVGDFPKQRNCVTRRFVFSASSLMDLKRKAESPTRVIAVTSLIWKSAMEASRMIKSSSEDDPRSSILIFPVDFRRKCLPPLSSCSIGNMFWMVCAQHKAIYEGNDDVQLSSVVRFLKNKVDKVNNDFAENMKGKNGSSKVKEYLNELKSIFSSDTNAKVMAISSMCNSGFYEADFGWGNPVWASIGDANSDIRLLDNFTYLIDTSTGGIEAWVTLDKQEMAIFEQDPNVLAYALINPSPLKMIA